MCFQFYKKSSFSLCPFIMFLLTLISILYINWNLSKNWFILLRKIGKHEKKIKAQVNEVNVFLNTKLTVISIKYNSNLFRRKKNYKFYSFAYFDKSIQFSKGKCHYVYFVIETYKLRLHFVRKYYLWIFNITLNIYFT